MSRLLKCQRDYFQLFVSKTSEIQRLRLLDIITNDQLRALVKNFLQKTLTVPPSLLTALKKSKRLLRSLADTSLTLKDKKEIVTSQRRVTEFLRTVQPSLKAYVQ